MKYVHNLGGFAAKFMWSYSLGDLTLRTSASGIGIQENMNKQTTHTCMYTYIYIYYLYIRIFGKIKLSINVHVCMHAFVYVWMCGKITNKQSFE